ncbi:LRR receptor-like kinase [Arachis hypogaea]|nr:LRR receptor-like kinase [Arachis hypogaea]
MNFSKSQHQLINLSYNDFFSGISVTIGALKKLEHLWLDSNSFHETLSSTLVNRKIQNPHKKRRLLIPNMIPTKIDKGKIFLLKSLRACLKIRYPQRGENN